MRAEPHTLDLDVRQRIRHLENRDDLGVVRCWRKSGNFDADVGSVGCRGGARVVDEKEEEARGMGRRATARVHVHSVSESSGSLSSPSSVSVGGCVAKLEAVRDPIDNRLLSLSFASARLSGENLSLSLLPTLSTLLVRFR